MLYRSFETPLDDSSISSILGIRYKWRHCQGHHREVTIHDTIGVSNLISFTNNWPVIGMAA